MLLDKCEVSILPFPQNVKCIALISPGPCLQDTSMQRPGRQGNRIWHHILRLTGAMYNFPVLKKWFWQAKLVINTISNTRVGRIIMVMIHQMICCEMVSTHCLFPNHAKNVYIWHDHTNSCEVNFYTKQTVMYQYFNFYLTWNLWFSSSCNCLIFTGGIPPNSTLYFEVVLNDTWISPFKIETIYKPPDCDRNMRKTWVGDKISIHYNGTIDKNLSAIFYET